ncbi:MAG: hypothetical protein K6G30_13535 [Acetatifactor sp.]|nr:hypothetical protein [Acetatifactor sp.]
MEKANRIYGKYLYSGVAAFTILISISDLIVGSDTVIKAVAHFMIAVVMPILVYWYVRGEKKSVMLFLSQIYEFYLASFLWVARITQAGSLVWQIFILIGVFGLFFVLSFRMKNGL